MKGEDTTIPAFLKLSGGACKEATGECTAARSSLLAGNCVVE
jgi:hypothetical protein